MEHPLLPMEERELEIGPLALAVFLLGGAEDGVGGVEVGEFRAEDGGDGGLAEAVGVLGFEPAAEVLVAGFFGGGGGGAAGGVGAEGFAFGVGDGAAAFGGFGGGEGGG